MKKYYVEFEFYNSENTYSMQSKFFDTTKEALLWYMNSFDYVNTDDMSVSLMYSVVDKNGEVDYSRFIEDITTKYHIIGVEK